MPHQRLPSRYPWPVGRHHKLFFFATSTFPIFFLESVVHELSDLPLAPQVCNLESYVDDSKIFLSFPVKDAESAERVLEEDLRRVAAWCSKNQLLINPEKTKFLMLGTQQLLHRLPKEIAISFLGKEITPVSSAKDLEITLYNNLTYDQHIHQLTSSCMTKLSQIKRVKNSFDRDTLRTIISNCSIALQFGQTQLPQTSRSLKLFRISRAE